MKYFERGLNHGFLLQPVQLLELIIEVLFFFFYSLRDRLIKQLTAELQALKEELESFRLEVSEAEKGR